MAYKKTYWKNIDQLKENNQLVDKLEQNEFVEKLPLDSFDDSTFESNASRRDFLKFVGFSTAAATLAACEGPVNKSVPYVFQPERIIPGIANYYATSISDGFDFANILVKTREGRPIKIENNNESPFFGSANARVNASVLSMYDSNRIKGPKVKRENRRTADDLSKVDIDWNDLNSQIISKLREMSQSDKKIVLLTQTIASPTTKKIISDFIEKFPNINHVVYDTTSESSSLDAYENIFGIRALPDYDFSKADSIVSIGSDFLSDWQGGGFDCNYAKKRVPKKVKGKSSMSKHFQFEANMSLTGANADHRFAVKPSDQKKILAYIYNVVFGSNENIQIDKDLKAHADKAISSLLNSAEKAVLVTGIQDSYAQELALSINMKLNSQVIDFHNPRLIRSGSNIGLEKAINDILSGSVSGLITYGVNPVYSLSNGEEFGNAIKNLDLSLAFSMKEDETASLCDYIAATPHYLESWGDYEFKKDFYSLAQPTIKPLFNTLQFQDVILRWSGNYSSYYNSIKEYWRDELLDSFSWNKVLHDGYFNKIKTQNKTEELKLKDLSNDLKSYSNSSNFEFELTLYTKVGMGDGQQSNNPWLQEFPDPITRASWDNYLTISAADAKNLGIKNVNVANGALNGSYANVKVKNTVLKVPVIIQPGQAKQSIGLALGYGKVKGIKEEMQVGVNAFKFYDNFNPVQDANVSLADGFHEFACVQLHNTLMGRGDIVKETTLEIFNTKNKKDWNPIPVVSKNHIEEYVTSPEVDMYKEFDRSIGHHFNLSIDLNACTGCGACVIACHAENNVPVVGKREVRKSRDMHWLSIDRYYSSEDSFREDNDKKDNIDGLGDSLTVFGKMEKASENPQVTFQPVMCQHCNHAPCETVCPVAATSHGRQGQNHMAYNRCVGTRYCANNCPYKVRRFNWFLYNNNDEFDFHMNDDLGKMVINPDVVVRSRGVMEKCSFCIQMTQKTILDAKIEGRQIKDGEFSCACSNACSSGAMVFGDVNDKESKVSELKENDRMYHLLESVGTKPNVMYQVKVRNTES
jgi:molybdopterin-containing oxidoreductase family iron-sulfur binding subunit